MRVLWFSCTPSMYDEKLYGGWVASLERVVRDYCPDIELGIAFEHTDNIFKKEKDGVTYYPMNNKRGWRERLDVLFHYDAQWKYLQPLCKRAIGDFKPDVIQCFGSEWPFGLVSEFTKTPVVIHMQGFSTIYRMSSFMSLRTFDHYKYKHYNPLSIFHYWYRSTKGVASDNREKRIMKANCYFMGRTEWDKNIVKYYSQGARYFHLEEVIRREISQNQRRWQYEQRDKMRLVTISSASGLKGNSIILLTAKLMKEFGFDFEWRVAGSKDSFKLFESIYNLHHEDYNIHLLGYIDTAQIVDELCAAEAYVHTAIIDNSPNSLCEAQLIGCPIVSTNVGGIPQLVDNGNTGILFPYNEPHTLAFTLMNVHGQQAMLENLSHNEIEVSHKRHDEIRIARELQDIYNEITTSVQ